MATPGVPCVQAQATCTNTSGSFVCTCDAPQWEGDGVSCTYTACNINPCIHPLTCHPDGSDGYTCTCDPPYGPPPPHPP